MTALPAPRARLSNPTRRLWQDAPGFTALALLLAAALVPLTAAALLDARLFQGDPIWLKPIKFHIALTIYLLTLAFFARYLRPAFRAGRGWRLYSAVVIFAVVAEVTWIGGAAALGTASHFNVATPLAQGLYALMGLFAVTLTSPSLVMGVAIWRNPGTGLAAPLRLSVALGLGLTFVLTVIVAGTMSSQGGHFVGTPVSGARLPVLGWSREVGDLRVAHFLATHALHGLPLVGLAAARWLAEPAARAVVLAAAAAYAALVLGSFAQALAGLPLLG